MSKKISNGMAEPEKVPGKVLVKHYRLHSNSSDVDSSSVRYQHYAPDVYDEMVREDEQHGKQNNFVRLGLKSEVIYNPPRDKDGNPTDVKKHKVSDTSLSDVTKGKEPADSKKGRPHTGKADHTSKSKDKVDNTGGQENTGIPDNTTQL